MSKIPFSVLADGGTKKKAQFFSLKNDGDSAIVRFLYHDPADIVAFSVHKVTENGKFRQVNCLAEPGDRLDVCPICASERNRDFSQKTKKSLVYIPMQVQGSDDVVFWQRSVKWVKENLLPKFRKVNDLCTGWFEVERIGCAGDTSTKYEITKDSVDPTLTIPEIPDISGLIQNKTYEEMQNYVATGRFDAPEEESPLTSHRSYGF